MAITALENSPGYSDKYITLCDSIWVLWGLIVAGPPGMDESTYAPDDRARAR